MILGYLDKEDRAYDLGFSTLKMKIRIETAPPRAATVVTFAPTGPADAAAYRVIGEADATVSVSMDHGGDRVPLLRPVRGHLYRHEQGLLFIASPPSRDPGDPSFFLVKLQAMPSAVQFFFDDQEGAELVSISRDEVIRIEPRGKTVTLLVSAANLALPKEKLAYAVELDPASAVSRLLSDLMSPAA